VASRATLLDLLRYAVNFEIILVEGSGECAEMSCMSRCRHRRYAPSSKFGNYFILKHLFHDFIYFFSNCYHSFLKMPGFWLELQQHYINLCTCKHKLLLAH